ncbi:unnamed protein product [Heterotrigona itama]|uniref:Ig-like domain-containing protein n=1 Tax=Heterotrigona itama TaxID=395501 RepID=A0A6V7H9Q9_9HYME|nr:unnamed protein product [Heterotrigona itama]
MPDYNLSNRTPVVSVGKLVRQLTKRDAERNIHNYVGNKVERQTLPIRALLVFHTTSVTFQSASIHAANEYRSFLSTLLTLPPMLWIPHQLVGAPLDHAVTLECYTEAHPTSLNYWTREDGLMIQGNQKHKTTSMPEKPSYKTHMTLTIYDLQEVDYGTYKCVAKNPRGETDGTIRLYSKCRLFTRILKYPVGTFVELMTDRRAEHAS